MITIGRFEWLYLSYDRNLLGIGLSIILWCEHNQKLGIVFNSLPGDKILDWSKFKAFAYDKIHVTEDFKFVLGTVENILGKGENVGYQHFLLFLQCFPKGFSAGLLKVVFMWERVNLYIYVQVFRIWSFVW